MRDIGVEQIVPLLLVQSMEASLRFYVDGLGFTITNKWVVDGRVRWCWLQLGGAAIMLQEFVPDEGHERRPPEHVGAGVGFNFICRDAIAFYHAMRDRSVTTSRPFVGNKMWVTSLKDPDGYDLHFESPTDAPEESEYDADQIASAPDPSIRLVPVFRTGEPTLIAIAKSLLEGEGIEYLVRSEPVQNLFGWGGLGAGYNIITGPAEFVVRADEAERAQELLQQLSTRGSSHDSDQGSAG